MKNKLQGWNVLMTEKEKDLVFYAMTHMTLDYYFYKVFSKIIRYSDFNYWNYLEDTPKNHDFFDLQFIKEIKTANIIELDDYFKADVNFPEGAYYEIYINKKNSGNNRLFSSTKELPTIHISDELTKALLSEEIYSEIDAELSEYLRVKKITDIYVNSIFSFFNVMQKNYKFDFSLARGEKSIPHWKKSLEKNCVPFQYRIAPKNRLNTVYLPLENFIPEVRKLQKKIIEAVSR